MNRLELRLGDTMDSEFDRKVAANVPAGVPGRGQTPEKMHFMGAVPRIDSIHSDGELSEATAAMMQRGQAALDGPGGPGRTAAAARTAREPAPEGRRPAGAGRGLRDRREQPGTGIRRLRDRPVLPGLRRERVREDGAAAVVGQADLGAVRRERGEDRRRRLPAHRCWSAIPDSHLLEYAPMSNSMESTWTRSRT